MILRIDDPRGPLTELADIIKVDMRRTTLAERAAMIKRYGPWRCRMLAEKVETREEFFAAQESRLRLFSGIFLSPAGSSCHPRSSRQPDQLRAHAAGGLAPGTGPREIEELIKSEASLCYRLLRYLNSAVFGFANEIHSVRHALSMLGEREVRRWVRLVATLAAGSGKSSELVLSALVRARFCELLSPKIRTWRVRFVSHGPAFHDGCDS